MSATSNTRDMWHSQSQPHATAVVNGNGYTADGSGHVYQVLENDVAGMVTAGFQSTRPQYGVNTGGNFGQG
jgi:hypothetical protein